MSEASRIRIDVLGTSFSIIADEDAAYLEQILRYLERKIQETRERSPSEDPLKISILTSFYIIDELFQAKKLGGTDIEKFSESEEMEMITRRLIADIDNAIPD